MSKTNARKFFQTVSMLGQAACLALVPFTGCSRAAAFTALGAANFFAGLHSGGFLLLVGDMTDNFASTLYAITNLLTYAVSIVAPYLVGLVLEARDLKHRRQQWDLLFFITCGILVAGALLFDLLASAQRQAWDMPEREPKAKEARPRPPGSPAIAATVIDNNGNDLQQSGSEKL